MKIANPTLISLLTITSLTSIASASSQYPYNRGVVGIELARAASLEPNHYDLRVGLSLNVGDAMPMQNGQLDLSTTLDVFVDGQLMRTELVDAIIRAQDGSVPCDQQSSCDNQPCGVNDTPGGSFQMYCVAPVQFADCMCTSDVFIEVDDLFVPSNGGNITVELVAAANQLAELYTDDDSHTIPFLGSNYCTATANSTGIAASISATGSPSIGVNELTFEAGPLPTNQFGIFYYGTGSMQIPFGDGYRCVGGQTNRLPAVSSGQQGVLRTTVDLPSQAGQIVPGITQHFQAWYRDPSGGPVGFNLSDGYMIAFIP